MAKIIDGKAISAKILKDIKEGIAKNKAKKGLAVVLVGNNPASEVYVRNKKRACEEVGIQSFDHFLPESITETELLKLIEKLNRDKNVNGILIQLPLPKKINAENVLNAISPEKDVDGFHPVNLGRLVSGQLGLRPCTPLGIIELIRSTGIKIEGSNAVVVGRSNIVGKPVALMLLEEHATVTICHSRTKDLANVIGSADILVCAIGKPQFIKGEWIKNGAVVIDVGINRLPDGKITGDVEFDEASKHAGYITPVPGGVGPMTIAMLIKNTYETHTAI